MDILSMWIYYLERFYIEGEDEFRKFLPRGPRIRFWRRYETNESVTIMRRNRIFEEEKVM